MTAILEEMRRLDAAHARGEVSAVELAAAKAKLMDDVPDASEDADPGSTPTPPRSRPGLGQALLLCTLILTVCVGAALLLTGDIMLSATLAITVLAAFTVMLFRQIDG
ncbi:MAG: hypothetical protein AAFP16_12745 [Pseudomonadota bacterium]